MYTALLAPLRDAPLRVLLRVSGLRSTQRANGVKPFAYQRPFTLRSTRRGRLEGPRAGLPASPQTAVHYSGLWSILSAFCIKNANIRKFFTQAGACSCLDALRWRLWQSLFCLVALSFGIPSGCIFRANLWRDFNRRLLPCPLPKSFVKIGSRLCKPSAHFVRSTVSTSPRKYPGMIIGIYFRSGQRVKEGQSLIRLDDSIDLQTLNNSMAQLKLDRVTYERQNKLYKKPRCFKK